MVTSTLLQQTTVLLTSASSYLEDVDGIERGFGRTAELIMGRCPEYRIRYSRGREAHAMEILVDIRNNTVHANNPPKYRYLKTSGTPVELISRLVIVLSHSDEDAVLIMDPSVDGPEFWKELFLQVIEGTSRGSKPRVEYLMMGEYLISDAIQCVKLFDKRRTKPDVKAMMRRRIFLL